MTVPSLKTVRNSSFAPLLTPKSNLYGTIAQIQIQGHGVGKYGDDLHYRFSVLLRHPFLCISVYDVMTATIPNLLTLCDSGGPSAGVFHVFLMPFSPPETGQKRFADMKK